MFIRILSISYKEFSVIPSSNKQNGIGCSGDKVIKITKPDGVYFLKYSDNPGIKSEYEKLQWLHKKLLVPEIISYTEQDSKYYLLTRTLNGEMVCTPKYMQNWQDGLKVIQKAFEMLWSVDIKDCPFDESQKNKLKQIKNKLDTFQVSLQQHLCLLKTCIKHLLLEKALRDLH